MSRRRSHVPVVLGLSLASLLAAGACGLGDKQAQADRVVGAREALLESGGATGKVTIEVTPDEDNAPALAATGGEGQPALPRDVEVEMQVAFDFPRKSVRAIVIPPVNPLAALAAAAGGQAPPAEGAPEAPAPAAPAAAPTEPNALFHGDTTFVRRTNLRANERRVWAKLDFTRLPDDENPVAADETPGPAIAVAAANTINPIYLLDLAEGVLAGSMKASGTEDIAGVKTTRYEANISIEKALTDLDLDDDDRAVRELMFRLLRVREDVRPATFWVDPEGRLRRAQYELRQRLDRNDFNELLVTIDLDAVGPQGEVKTPNEEETVVLERFGRMIRSALPASAT